jgi:hypothetical protein
MFQKRCIWFLVSVLLAAALAQVAVWLPLAGFSAVVLFPLVIGAALGAAIGFVAVQVGETKWVLVIAGAILAAGVCAAGEHVFFYRSHCRSIETKLQNEPSAQLAAAMNPDLVKVPSFREYMAKDAPANWPLWILDALAMIGAAAIAAWFSFSSAPKRADGPAAKQA